MKVKYLKRIIPRLLMTLFILAVLVVPVLNSEEVEAVGDQSFFPLDSSVEVTPGTANAWTDVDVSAHVPAGATGVILRCVNTSESAYNLAVRKNGSTDNRVKLLSNLTQTSVMIGIDENRIFEAYVGSTTDIDIYLTGYTTSGVTFLTNGVDKSIGVTGAWTDVDCSAEAPNAIGLIFLVEPGSLHSFGIRKNGSGDNRINSVYAHDCYGAIVGCDTSQICENYIGSDAIDIYLIGYVTAGAIFNTNATDVSLGSTGSYQDLTALPAGSVMGFFEVTSGATSTYSYDLRKNGSAEEYYRYIYRHNWSIAPCDASGIIEGKISNVGVDFFVVGYATSIDVPTLTTEPATDLAITTSDGVATLNGNLSDMGGDSSVDCYFQYGLTNAYGTNTTVQALTGTGDFRASLTALTPGQSYHYRAIAENTAGTTYGDDATFSIPAFTSYYAGLEELIRIAPTLIFALFLMSGSFISFIGIREVRDNGWRSWVIIIIGMILIACGFTLFPLMLDSLGALL